MNTTTNLGPMVRAATPVTGKREFLVFLLGDQNFGIDVRNVQELCHFDALTRISDGPQLVDSVVVWRGRIAPMIDMRIHFNSRPPLYENLTNVIVLDIADRFICVVVDGIADVVGLTLEQVKPVQQIGSAFDTRCLIGYAECDQRNLILVDIAKVLFDSETASAPKKMAA